MGRGERDWTIQSLPKANAIQQHTDSQQRLHNGNANVKANKRTLCKDDAGST